MAYADLTENALTDSLCYFGRVESLLFGTSQLLNHCMSWSKFVNTHLFHSRQSFDMHLHTASYFCRVQFMTIAPLLSFTLLFVFSWFLSRKRYCVIMDN